MKIGAIVSEFNPFHNGHKYIVERAKKDLCTHVISIMSGNYVQRGEPAIISKRMRAEIALKNGVDLVVELPCVWSLSRAERYAEAGVRLADALGCVDFLIFGSECGDLKRLVQIEDTLSCENFHETLIKYLSRGLTFAKAREFAVSDLNFETNAHQIISEPNNILGIEYIKSIKNLDSAITPITFKRDESVKSASDIREFLKSRNETYRRYVPCGLYDNFSNFRDIFLGEKAIIAILKSLNLDDFGNLPDISEGLENKIYNSVRKCCGLNNLFELVKSKRYTMSRIKRIIMCAYLGITDKIQKESPTYIRVLGATEKGLEILKTASKTTRLPIISTYSELKKLNDFSREVFEIECKATDLLCVFGENVDLVESEKEFKFIRQE